MAKFLRRSALVVEVEYRRNFGPSEGRPYYSFPCDEQGEMADPSDRARVEALGLLDLGMARYETTYHEPALIRCECGRPVSLSDSWANGCECGREYNLSGQLLAPRHQWGEETGEHFSCSCGHCEDY
jgi:hypothetical protein